MGIGTTTLNGAKLVVNTGALDTPSVSGNMTTGVIVQVSTGSQALNYGNDATGAWYNAAYANNAGVGLAHRWLTGGAERMRITTAGNVGIGTSSPSSTLTVGGNPPAAGALAAVGAASGISLALSDNTNCSMYVRHPAGGPVIGTDGGNALRFAANGNATTDEKMRIDSAGNVGIGTSAPSASAILDAQSTTKGVRMPNMTTTQKNAISSPAAGLMVFDTTLAKLCVYSGSAWQTITSI